MIKSRTRKFTSGHFPLGRSKQAIQGILILVAAVLVIAADYTGGGIASPFELKPELFLPAYQGRQLMIVNDQASTKDVIIGQGYGGKLAHANLNQWTEAAVQVLRQSFIKAGVDINPASSKAIRLTITEAKLTLSYGGYSYRCRVNLHLKLGEQDDLDVYGEKVGRAWRACDAAITESIASVLRLEKFRNYLTQ